MLKHRHYTTFDISPLSLMKKKIQEAVSRVSWVLSSIKYKFTSFHQALESHRSANLGHTYKVWAAAYAAISWPLFCQREARGWWMGVWAVGKRY